MNYTETHHMHTQVKAPVYELLKDTPIYTRRSRRPGMRRTNACFSSSATRKTARCSRACMHYIAAVCMCMSCRRGYMQYIAAVCICILQQTCIHAYIGAAVCTCIFRCICIYSYSRVHMYIKVYMHIYKCSRVHMHIQVYMHIQLQPCAHVY